MADILGNLLDVGENLFPIGSRILGGDETKEASQQQQDRYLQMQQDYLNQIEPNRRARMDALGRSLSLFQPAGDALNQMYGTEYDFGSLLSSDPLTTAEAQIASENAQIANLQRQASEAEAQRNQQNDPVDWSGLATGLDEYRRNGGT